MSNISVIIPVFNKSAFIKEAVTSALRQIEVEEVILVDDGSTDGGSKICQDLEQKYSNVKLYHHENWDNRGASASRNLGLINAGNDYVAFLDADDIYLHDRFKYATQVFEKFPDCEGVYEAIGEFNDGHPMDHSPDKVVTSVNKKVDPEFLFKELFMGTCTHFSTDGIVLKREVFRKTGLFDEKIMTGQDTHMWYKISSTSRLYPGSLDRPVALRRIHSGPRLAELHNFENDRAHLWRSLFEWSINNNYVSLDNKLLMQLRFIEHQTDHNNYSSNTKVNRLITTFLFLFKYPRTIATYIRRFVN